MGKLKDLPKITLPREKLASKGAENLKDEEVYDTGFVINFVKEGSKKIEEEKEKEIVKEKVKILEV